MAYREVLRCKNHELLKLWDAWVNGQWVNGWSCGCARINESMVHRVSESMSQWTNESVNQWTTESMQARMDGWMDGGWMHGWMDGLMDDEWATSLLGRYFFTASAATSWLGRFFTARPLRWGTSSLSYFSEQPLSPRYLFSSFCNPKLLFSQLSPCV